MTVLAKSGAVLPPWAGGILLVLAVAAGILLVMEHRHTGLWKHPRLGRLRDQAEASAARELPPPLPPPAPRPPLPPLQVDAGNGHRPHLAVVGAPSRPAHLSAEYLAYLQGRRPSPIDGIRWPDRIAPWKRAHRAAGGRCDIGRVLARGQWPNCGSRAPLKGPIDSDHVSYDRLYHERREDIVFGCRSCHQQRTRLAKQGTDIYRLWGLP